MPIFHDYDGFLPQDSAEEPTLDDPARQRKPLQRGKRLSGQSTWSTGTLEAVEGASGELALRNGSHPRSINRSELIQRIKRGHSPSRGPHAEAHPLPDPAVDPAQPRHNSSTPSLLPAAEFKEQAVETLSQTADLSNPAEIERPRSALHSGDFREDRASSKDGAQCVEASPSLSTSPVAPWHRDFPSATHGCFPYHRSVSYNEPASLNRSRATSYSFQPTNFVFLPPTSPLVQQSNTTDIDFSPKGSQRPLSRSPDRNSRRHTFSPQSLQTLRTSLDTFPSRLSTDGAHPPVRREGSLPYQAHQPRRSLSAALNPHPVSTPQTPLMRPRRPSVPNPLDSSPLHHASLVGSYEESILRGRMSTLPSRPLNFVAEIGVLGKGKCKPSLRCPRHVVIPFPAVFYSYASGNGKISDDQPSPYVGLIDLEHSLPPAKESRRRRRHTPLESDNDDIDGGRMFRNHSLGSIPALDLRRREKLKRRSMSPKAPPGGSYRIPQHGQLQIVIKNPNKTAVKLFLVPYNLDDMEPGQKTFIRQRIYSAGPLVHTPLRAGDDGDGDAGPVASEPPTLRYLAHLRICCTARGRFYLHKSIRVVFANRVPDGKERLRHETQLPEPRYSAYKPSRDLLSAVTPSTVPSPASAAAGASSPTPAGRPSAAEQKALRRRMAGIMPTTVARPPGCFDNHSDDMVAVRVQESAREAKWAMIRLSRDSRTQMDMSGQGPGPDGYAEPGTGDAFGEPGPTVESERGDGALAGSSVGGPELGDKVPPKSAAEGLLARKLRGLAWSE